MQTISREHLSFNKIYLIISEKWSTYSFRNCVHENARSNLLGSVYGILIFKSEYYKTVENISTRWIVYYKLVYLAELLRRSECRRTRTRHWGSAAVRPSVDWSRISARPGRPSWRPCTSRRWSTSSSEPPKVRLSSAKPNPEQKKNCFYIKLKTV